MPTPNDYMYQAWRSMFQAAGAPPPAIPGLGAFNNPYAFSIAGAGAAFGMPPGIAQGPTGQLMEAFLPQALGMLTGDSTLADRLTGNNRNLLGNISRARQSQAVLSALNAEAQGATRQNIAGVIQAAGLNDILEDFGFTGNDAAGFLMQTAPFIDPRLPNMINRFDPAGGSLGLGTALYQATLSGTRNTRINENTAAILGEQFQRAFTQQRQAAGGDFRLLDVEATSGFTLPQMGILMQQARARGITGDVLAGSAGMGLIDRLVRGANEEMRPDIEDIAAQVRRGDLTTAEGLGRLQDRGLVSSTRIQEEREAAIQENLQRDQPRLEQLGRGVAQAGAIFETLQDNIPALLEQLENLTGNLQNVDETEIRRALANFQSLVEISGTTAEVLSEQAQIVASRVGVSFERGARLATDINLTAARLQETGLGVGEARMLAEADITFLGSQALQSQRVQDLANAAQFATAEGQARLQRAVREGDDAFLANPLQALIDAGQVTDVEAAQALQRDIAAGNRLDTETVERILSSQGLEAGQVAISQIRSQALRRARAAGVDLGGIGADISRRFNRAAEDAGIEGRLGDLSDEQALEVAAISARVRAGEISAEEAAALVSARFGVGTLDPRQAGTFFRSVGATAGRFLTQAERTALGIGATFEISQEQREAARRDQERIRQQTEQQLLNADFNRGFAGFLNILDEAGGLGKASVGEVFEAALVAGGVLLDEEAFQRFSADQLTDEEAERIRELQRRIQNAETPEEKARLQRELSQFAAEVGGAMGITVDQTMSAVERQARQRVREQLGADRLPELSEQAMEASGRLARLNQSVESRREAVEAAKQEREAAFDSGDRERIIEAQERLKEEERGLESALSSREKAQAELRNLVEEDRRTARESKEESKDGERENRTSRESADEDSREGSGTPRTFELKNARIVLETDIGSLVGEMVGSLISTGSLANRTEQKGNN